MARLHRRRCRMAVDDPPGGRQLVRAVPQVDAQPQSPPQAPVDRDAPSSAASTRPASPPRRAGAARSRAAASRAVGGERRPSRAPRRTRVRTSRSSTPRRSPARSDRGCLARSRVLEGGEMANLAPPALAHGVGEIAMEVGEEEEGRVSPHSSPMNSSGTCGDSSRIAVSARSIRGAASAVSRSPKARLPIWSWFCRKFDEGRRRQMPARLAARFAAERELALIGETLGQRAGDFSQRSCGEVGVVALALAGRDDMGGVVEVVVPFGRIERVAAIRPRSCRWVMLRLSSVVRWTWPVRVRRADGSGRSRRAARPATPGRGSGRSRRAAGRRTGTPRASRARCR